MGDTHFSSNIRWADGSDITLAVTTASITTLKATSAVQPTITGIS